MREVWITFKELVDLTVCVNHQAVAELNVEFFEISPNKEGKLVMSAGRCSKRRSEAKQKNRYDLPISTLMRNLFS